jgi:uncharacterized membrane protein
VVDGAGVLRAVAPGRVTVSATAEGVSGSMRVVVTHGYTLRLVDIAGVEESRAVAMNGLGDVLVAVGAGSGRARGYLWRDGAGVAIGDSALDVQPLGVNTAGGVVGTFLREGRRRPFLFRDGDLTDLDPDGARNTVHVAVNAAGAVVGFTLDGGEAEAFAWSGGHRSVLEPVDGWSLRPRALGDDGMVVGAAAREAERRAFHLREGTLTLLPGSTAAAVGPEGTVVGRTEAGGAFRWRAGSVTGTLAAAEGGVVAPAAVNASGTAVGSYAVFTASAHPAARSGFVWFGDDAVRLDRLARHAEWEVLEAAGIDARGRIAATARHRTTGRERAVLLTPR